MLLTSISRTFNWGGQSVLTSVDVTEIGDKRNKTKKEVMGFVCHGNLM